MGENTFCSLYLGNKALIRRILFVELRQVGLTTLRVRICRVCARCDALRRLNAIVGAFAQRVSKLESRLARKARQSIRTARQRRRYHPDLEQLYRGTNSAYTLGTLRLESTNARRALQYTSCDRSGRTLEQRARALLLFFLPYEHNGKTHTSTRAQGCVHLCRCE